MENEGGRSVSLEIALMREIANYISYLQAFETRHLTYFHKKICRDGPVLDAKLQFWGTDS